MAEELGERLEDLAAGRATRAEVTVVEGLGGSRVWRVAGLVVAVALGAGAWGLASWLAADGLGSGGAVMLGIFAATAWLWTTGALPAFATAILAMGLMAGLLGLGPGAGAEGSDIGGWHEFIAPAAAPVIVLMLGGFVLARGVAKVGLDTALSRRFVAPFARNGATLVLGVLLVTGWMSMWMSNTATAAMMVALVAPLASSFEPGSRARAMVYLAVPVGANIGGMGTPIGTPPNAIAFAALHAAGVEITFLGWMAFAMPLAAAMLVISWGLLAMGMEPAARRERVGLRHEAARPATRWPRLVVGSTFTVTVALWVTGPWTGVPVSAAALVPIVLLTATGVLDRRDINGMEWDILLLMAGGLALGHGMEATGLAHWLIGGVPIEGAPLWVVLAALCAGVLALSTFMSNTAVANLAMPIGMGMAGLAAVDALEPLAAGIIVALGASLALCLPVSTPPNAIAYASGSIRLRDFVRYGAAIGAVGVALSTATVLVVQRVAG